MTETSTDQLRRLLALVPLLADGEAHALARVADRVGADAPRVWKDLRALVERYDVPGGFVEGVTVYLGAGPEPTVQLRTDHFLRPMRLTGAELQALGLGLAVLAHERPPEERAVVAAARARLERVVAKLPAGDGLAGDGPTDPQGAARPGAGPDVAAEFAPLDDAQRAHLAVVRDARRRRRAVRITYRKSGAAAATARDVCPYALVVASGAWYVVGWCSAGEGVRVFRLDRIERAEPTDSAFEIPASFSVDAVVRDGRAFATDVPPRTLVVRYGPAVARWVAEREGRAPDADGSLTLEQPLADAEWAVRHMLQYGAEAEVLAPPDVRAAVAARLDAMLAAAPAAALPAPAPPDQLGG